MHKLLLLETRLEYDLADAVGCGGIVGVEFDGADEEDACGDALAGEGDSWVDKACTVGGLVIVCFGDTEADAPLG